MGSPDAKPHRHWIKRIPRAHVARPTKLKDWVKFGVWIIIVPLHPYGKEVLLRMGIIKHSGRQKFLLGKIAPGETIESVSMRLVEHGYGNHFVAWDDDGQVVSLRNTPSFTHQYHVRIFHDGEVRAHYELTPESYPFKHLKEVGMEARREEFLALLEDKITPLEDTEE